MNIIPMTIESLVAVLLLMTILYCVRLNSQLKRLRADETVMKEVIADLTKATDRAERSIAELKGAVAEADNHLGDRLHSAERFCAEISKQTQAGNDLLNRLTRVVTGRPAAAAAAKPAAPPQPATPDPKALVAAAQAFTERARALLKDRAA